jgi:hypothetical protein
MTGRVFNIDEYMKKLRITYYIAALMLFLLSADVFAQTEDSIDAPLINFTRGKLWHSLYFGKSGPAAFSNWLKTGPGLDWPGFDATKINEDIDGSPSYLSAGGLYVGCKQANDSALVVEEWCRYASTVSNESTAKYIVRKHKKYSDNHGMLKRNSGGEEVIETVWEYNPNFPNAYEPQRQLPVRVTRRAHQWNGSQRDENYIIYEYVIKNISNELQAYKESRKIVDTLFDFYAMFTYGIHANSRSWSVLFPSLTSGARNTFFTVDTTKKDYYTSQTRTMVYGRAGDYTNETGTTTAASFGFDASRGQKLKDSTGAYYSSGEWLAPGFAGIRLLSSPADKIRNKANKINKIAWSAVDNNQDLGGPLTGKSGVVETAYSVLVDPANAYNAVTSTSDALMGKRRMWTMMSLGPWDILPGDSIVIAVAEIVDGIDYSKTTGANRYAYSDVSTVNQLGRDLFEKTSDKAQFTYNHGLRHPVPPLAPSFTVGYYKEKSNFVANEIVWQDSCEAFADPDDGTLDLAGYRLYRSEYLPIGPWTLVADITKGDSNCKSGSTYTFIDSTVEIGSSYYYALTAYDTGKTTWSVAPATIFKETGTTKVPPLESSIFANRTTTTFVATTVPPNNLNSVLVVPNPFVIGAGSSQPGVEDVIQFVNIPNPCTIRIYTVRGDLIKTINVDEGSGAIASWDQATDYGQYVTSGVYIYHLESRVGNKIGKFAIVR